MLLLLLITNVIVCFIENIATSSHGNEGSWMVLPVVTTVLLQIPELKYAGALFESSMN